MSNIIDGINQYFIGGDLLSVYKKNRCGLENDWNLFNSFKIVSKILFNFLQISEKKIKYILSNETLSKKEV